MKIIQHLLSTIQNVGVYNPETQVAPICILWPDKDRQWEAVVPLIQSKLPEFFILGDYSPETKTGPAIWLRCLIGGETAEITLPKDRIAIFYLPGISRQDLRAVETCPEHLKALAELQYRGVIWSQINAKDWTILAYLKSEQGGLGLEVALDNDTKNTMQLALYQLLDQELEPLTKKRLDKDYFNGLLTGGDLIRNLLVWLDQPEAFESTQNENEWQAFVAVCISQLRFDPQNDGVLIGAAKLANHEGAWGAVWNRFCEAPNRYPNIPFQIRKCQTPSNSFPTEHIFDGWPQWNDTQEKQLANDLITLAKSPAHKARNKLKELEKYHAARRSLVWAELGEASLACALEHLAEIAKLTESNLAAGSAKDLAEGYCNYGWKVDDKVLRALAHSEKTSDFEAISTAIRAVYLPWAEESARHLQKIIDGSTYPGGTCLSKKASITNSGDCILFVDGLRFDTAKRLVDLLKYSSLEIFEEAVWIALPSVTATGKAAVTPVQDKIRGLDDCADFEPSIAKTGQSLKGGYHLRKLLNNEGWTILERYAVGNGQGKAWCEFGDIDHEGHDRGWKLAKHIDVILIEIRERILALLDAGWKRIQIVTDHGWLLLPGGLPKIELPSALTENKWGRCASLKAGASTDERLYPWYWNPSQYFALADGISCFKNGEEYTHGGLSLQECLTLQITVTPSVSTQITTSIEITDVVWKGLRCTIAVIGDFHGVSLDIRTQAGNSQSSVVLGIKPLKDNGTASVVVEDENIEGFDAMIVLIDANGSLLAQIKTIIGGEK